MPPRVLQLILVASFISFSWLMMQAFHEMGHVIGAAATGGQIQKIVLHPLAFSRTDVNPNPHPIIEVWAGPIMGILLPVIFWLIVRNFGSGVGMLSRFLAGFCCIANGTYIAFGPGTAGMDTQQMLSLGCERWQLVAFGVPAAFAGILMWNGTGKVFGIPNERVDPRHVCLALALLTALVTLEVIRCATG